MKPTLYRRLIIILALGFVLSALIAFFSFGSNAALALVSGYGLFSLNFLLLIKIYGGLVTTMQNGGQSGSMKTAILLGSAIKFFGLIAALYIMLVHWKLSGLYVAAGSLVSLFVLTSFLLSSYTKSFGNSPR